MPGIIRETHDQKARSGLRLGLRTADFLISITILVCLCANPACAAPGGPPRCMWLGGFNDIDLGTIADSQTTVTGASQCNLKANCDVELAADNSIASRLTGPGGDFLLTEYALSVNGGQASPFTSCDSFLSPPVVFDYNGGDFGPWMQLEVSLHVRASNPPGEAANAGEYRATQTLTAHW